VLLLCLSVQSGVVISFGTIPGIRFWGEVGSYAGFGYVVDWPSLTNPNGVQPFSVLAFFYSVVGFVSDLMFSSSVTGNAASTTARHMMQDMFDNNWIDAKTRVVFVEFRYFSSFAQHPYLQTRRADAFACVRIPHAHSNMIALPCLPL
jgi:hypothetical protein